MSAFPLTPEQQAALDSRKHIFVEAGAGTGKTRILVERYLHILEQNPKLDLNGIIAFTFTQKAAQEMMTRIQETIESPTNTLPYGLKTKITEQLYTAPISTIHQFCLQCLKKYPLEAGIDPDIALLDPLHASYLFNQSINDVLTQEIQNETPQLQKLLETATVNHIKKDIITFSHNHAFLNKTTLKDLPEKTLEESFKTPHYLPTKTAFDYIQTLYQLYLQCRKQYQHKKQQFGKCDFDDLIQHTIELIENHSSVQTQLQQQHPYLMVDEFQDTDPLQWKLITKLTGGIYPETFQTNLFLVGDLKQSIYSFRGATADLFDAVQTQFKSSPHTASVITLKDNFRSHTQLMNSINTLFPPIFNRPQTEDVNLTKVTYHPLIGNKSTKNGGYIHTCFLEDPACTIQSEIDAITQWITTHQQTHPNTKLEDIAILFRRKHPMEMVKKHLDTHGLPTQILSQQNLYQNQAIIDMFAILKALIEPYDNLAWRTVLRSPFYGWSETNIYELFTTQTTQNIPSRLANPPETIASDTKELWQKASKSIQPLLQLAKEAPLSYCIDWLLTQTGAWAIYTQPKTGSTTSHMIEQFIEKCRNLESEVALSNLDMLTILENSIKTGEREKEQTKQPQKGQISLLSIHGSKGLEYPIVIIPECAKAFNFDGMNRLPFSTTMGPGLSLKKGKNENIHRQKVLHQLKNVTIEEEKRLFYVACTRAINHLVLSAHYKPNKIPDQSYLGFLKECGQIENGHFSPTYPTTYIKSFNYQNKHLPPSTSYLKDQLTLFPETLPIPIPPRTIESDRYIQDQNKSQQKKLKPPCLTPHIQGTLSHQALQKYIESPKEPLIDIAYTVLYQNNIPKIYHSQLHSHLLRQLQTLAKHPLSKQLQTAQLIETEKPFTYKKEGSLIRGRVDLIFQHNQTLHIVDFKTGQNTPTEYNQLKEIYYTQVQKYAETLAHSYRHIEKVNISILQTHLNLTNTWSLPIKTETSTS